MLTDIISHVSYSMTWSMSWQSMLILEFLHKCSYHNLDNLLSVYEAARFRYWAIPKCLPVLSVSLRAPSNGIRSIAMQWNWKQADGGRVLHLPGFTAFDLFTGLWMSINLRRVEPSAEQPMCTSVCIKIYCFCTFIWQVIFLSVKSSR